jgi:hypothetical protein
METYEYSNLKKCPVEFDELAHTYTLDGKQLRGITGIIKDYLFPDMYKGVHERTLEAAAERGSSVHSQVQMIINGFPPARTDRSVEAFFDKKQGTEFIASEYLVSDLHHFASSIDIIDSRLNLYDIKTTDKLNREYLSWQLSIYAYLFELQNPTLKAGALYGCHLRDGKANVIQVERINSEIIADFLCAAADNLPWSNPLERIDDTLLKDQATQLARLAEIEDYLADFKARAKAMEDEKAKLTEGLLDIMEQRNVKTYKTDRLTLTRIDAHTSPKFDSTTFKRDYPQMYERYVKESQVKRSLRIAIK